MLRLALLSTITLGLVLTACGSVVKGGGGGSGGDTTTTTTTSGDVANKCTPAGGTCTALVPGGCAGGVWASYEDYPCGDDLVGVGCCMPAANECEAAGGTCMAVGPGACLSGKWGDSSACVDVDIDDVSCCLPVCEPGADQTCNDVASMSSFAGHCNPDGTCTCGDGFTKQPNGKCAP